jgi:endonuclease G
MRKLLLVLLLVCGSAVAWNQRAPLPVQSCQTHSPYGFPQSSRQIAPICRQAYLVGYDAAAKLPEFVTYTMLPQNALGCWPRTNAFVADQSIKGGPKPDDYIGTGYDKGHAAPDGDLSWDEMVEYESFLMTNMYPQAGSLNRGIWKLLETSVRGWAVQLNQPLTIYVGGIYNPQDKKIGDNITVPHAFYKIVINQTTKQAAGWMFPHTAPYPNLGNDLTKYRMPIAQIMQQASVKFMFPPGTQEIQPGKEWPVDYGMLTKAKRAKCKGNAE